MRKNNFTITPNHDGFGAQYLRCLSGLAFCENGKRYRYIHSAFNKMDHVDAGMIKNLVEFAGIPDMTKGRHIHIRRKGASRCSLQYPDKYFNGSVTKKILNFYYRYPKPDECNTDICIHIRRGDLHTTGEKIGPPRRKMSAKNRMSSNEYYSRTIGNIIKTHTYQSIKIHTQGTPEEFETITSNWSQEMKMNTEWVFDCDIRSTFHDFVTCKKFFMARSCLSYVAALLREEKDTYFQNGPCNWETAIPKINWNNWREFE